MLVEEPEEKPRGLIVVLTGRGVDLAEMYQFILHCGVADDSVLMILEPQQKQWYPRPNGTLDQDAAVKGSQQNAKPVLERIKSIAKMHKIPHKKIVLVGYSAGGVMALQIAQLIDFEMAMIISLSGIVLAPDTIPEAKHNTPILIKMGRYDEVFEWEERYIPTRDSLLKNKYNLSVHEDPNGDHGLRRNDCFLVKRHVDSVL